MLPTPPKTTRFHPSAGHSQAGLATTWKPSCWADVLADWPHAQELEDGSGRPRLLRAGARTAKGPVREENQDKCYADALHGVFVIADGMGGYLGGAEASRIALDCLTEPLLAATENPHTDLPDFDRAATQGAAAARRCIQRLAEANPEFSRMGATLAWACITGRRMYFDRIGDCRVYLLRDGQLTRLLNDETFVQCLLEGGVLSDEQVGCSPWRHLVTNAVSRKPLEHQPEVNVLELQPNDRVVLTTDGVSDALTDAQIRDILDAHSSPQEAADALVYEALRAGSRDNASSIVIKYLAWPTASTASTTSTSSGHSE